MIIHEELARTALMTPDTSDELAILAKDCAGLKKSERELIERAGDELRECYRYIAHQHRDLHEARAHGMAMSEQLKEMRAKIDAQSEVKPPQPGITWTPLISSHLVVNGPVYGKPFGA
jgi:hypothetical protein